VDVQGKKIITIEGLADERKPQPLQKAFVERGRFNAGSAHPG